MTEPDSAARLRLALRKSMELNGDPMRADRERAVRESPRVDVDLAGRRAELTEEEVARLRALLAQDDRVRWFWATVKVWATWATAVAAGWLLFKDSIKTLLRGALGN